MGGSGESGEEISALCWVCVCVWPPNEYLLTGEIRRIQIPPSNDVWIQTILEFLLWSIQIQKIFPSLAPLPFFAGRGGRFK